MDALEDELSAGLREPYCRLTTGRAELECKQPSRTSVACGRPWVGGAHTGDIGAASGEAIESEGVRVEGKSD